MDLIVGGKVEVRYERYTRSDASFISKIAYKNNEHYYLDFDKSLELMAGYNFYFSELPFLFRNIHVYPFMKYRSLGRDRSAENVYNRDDWSYNGMTMGLGIGKKWYWNDQVTFGFYGEIERFLGDSPDGFGQVYGDIGIVMGYKF